MKTITDLCVTVKYTVQLSELVVSDEVAESLHACSEQYDFNGLTADVNMEMARGIEWLNDNIREADACDITYDIDDIIIEE